MVNTFIKPVARIRLAESGGIKVLAQNSVVKAMVSDDDESDVRLPVGSYRIVMQCRSAGDATKKETAFPNR
jgi:hypothetical protein